MLGDTGIKLGGYDVKLAPPVRPPPIRRRVHPDDEMGFQIVSEASVPIEVPGSTLCLKFQKPTINRKSTQTQVKQVKEEEKRLVQEEQQEKIVTKPKFILSCFHVSHFDKLDIETPDSIVVKHNDEYPHLDVFSKIVPTLPPTEGNEKSTWSIDNGRALEIMNEQLQYEGISLAHFAELDFRDANLKSKQKYKDIIIDPTGLPLLFAEHSIQETDRNIELIKDDFRDFYKLPKSPKFFTKKEDSSGLVFAAS
jgi:hypothetical protein